MRIRDAICEVIARQRWASKRLRTALINIITPEFMINHDFETEFFGYRYRGNTKNLIDRKVLFSGCHECDVLSFMKDVLVDQDDSVYIDVGANVGHHVLFMCRYASAVFAFEPYQSVRDQLEEKLDLNSVDNVKVLSFALGEKAEKRVFSRRQMPIWVPDPLLKSSRIQTQSVNISKYAALMTIFRRPIFSEQI